MQNRGALWIFTILLGLACLWQLSFTFFTNRFERAAVPEIEALTDSAMTLAENQGKDRGAVYIAQETKYFRAHAEEEIYPVFGHSYRYCKEREMNMGLDLQGGMAVTLEVSIPELVEGLSEGSDNEQFVKAMANARIAQRTSDKDFITLFGEEWNRINPDGRLAAVFHNQENQAKFQRDASNAEVLAVLQREAETAIVNTENIMRQRIDKFGVSQPSIQKQQFSGRIQIELPGVKDKARVRKVLQSTANLEFWETYDNQEFGKVLDEANKPLSAYLYPELAAADSAKTDTTAAAADTTAVQAEDLAKADTSAIDTTASDTTLAEAEEEPVDTAALIDEQRKRFPLYGVLGPNVDERGMFQKGPYVGFCMVADTAEANRLLNTPAVRNVLPGDAKLLWGAKPDAAGRLALYALKVPKGTNGKPKLDGSVIIDAAQDFDLKGDVEVRMQMDAKGAQDWKRITAENVGKCVAVVLDDMVYTAPEIREEIPSGSSSISLGSGTVDDQIREADDLANILKAGALPAPSRIIDETVVGPTLGAENVRTGMVSFLVALIGVLLVMWAYYARSGWIADIALLCNVFFLVGTMASLQATLTLPGIAGIVLTVGMAVDANVLVNERVREELRAGKNLKGAITTAFSASGALSAIIDSNVTTFITAVILFIFGSGPIQGFATTTGIGILTSLFTALFISRLVMERRLEKGRSISFWHGWSRNVFVNANYDFMGRRKLFYGLSALLLGAGVYSMVTRGFNWGVDFDGGRSYVVQFDQAVEGDAVEAAVRPFLKHDGREYSVTAKTYGGERQLKITTNYLIDQSTLESDSLAEARMNEALTSLGIPFSGLDDNARKVDPTISDDIKTGAWTAVLVALVFMFIYIAIRFSNWQYGVGALLSLVHDTVFVLGLYSLLWGRVGFSLEIDEAFIAVILTVIGYSINDTVVVFDRIREYMRDHKREPVITVFNKALNATLSRTLNTGFNTMLVLLIIFFFGGVSIQGFVFGLFAGILVGTYSSIFVASAVAVELLRRRKGVAEAAPSAPVTA